MYKRGVKKLVLTYLEGKKKPRTSKEIAEALSLTLKQVQDALFQLDMQVYKEKGGWLAYKCK